MLDGLREVNAAAMPFARLFCGQCSEYLWEDDLDEIHTISQGEGGKQGDAMMLLSHSLGQHRALEEVARRLTARATTSLSVSLWRNAGIRIHVGKTQMWNRGGTSPLCAIVERAAQAVNPNARQTDKASKSRHLQAVVAEHQILLDRIPRVKDIQNAWLLLLHCASARANYQIRSVDPISC